MNSQRRDLSFVRRSSYASERTLPNAMPATLFQRTKGFCKSTATIQSKATNQPYTSEYIYSFERADIIFASWTGIWPIRNDGEIFENMYFRNEYVTVLHEKSLFKWWFILKYYENIFIIHILTTIFLFVNQYLYKISWKLI